MCVCDIPERESDEFVNLVPPDVVIAKGEFLQLDNENLGQPPNGDLLCSLTRFFALWTVPTERYIHAPSFSRIHITL